MDRLSRRIVGIIVGVALMTVFGPAALANAATTSNKPYSLTIATTSNPYDTASGEVASGEAMTMTATFTNESTIQQIGSANLFWPAGFSVSVQSPSTASVSQNCTDNGVSVGACVQLRNLALAPNGGSVTVKMSVVTPKCQKGPVGWSAEVKQANNFNGTPGNDFVYDTSSSQTEMTLDGACSLQFSQEPADALTGQPIPGALAGSAVAVQVVDINGNLVPTSTIPITMSTGINPFGGTLAGTTAPLTVAGTATFPDLTLNLSGLGYTLVATPGPTGGTSLSPVSSTPFDIQDQTASCAPNASCSTTVNGSTLVANAGSSTGELVESALLGSQSQQTLALWQALCGSSYTSADPYVYESGISGATDRSEVDTITFPAPKTNLNPQQVLKAQQICFGDTVPFPTASGAPDGTFVLPNGQTLYVGLLPTCTGSTATPCHNRQQDTTVPDKRAKSGYDVVLVDDVPALWADDPYRM